MGLRCISVGTHFGATHLHFIGGQVQAFGVANRPQRHWVELSFVEVGHGRVAGLDVNRFGGSQGVFKVTWMER